MFSFSRFKKRGIGEGAAYIVSVLLGRAKTRSSDHISCPRRPVSCPAHHSAVLAAATGNPELYIQVKTSLTQQPKQQKCPHQNHAFCGSHGTGINHFPSRQKVCSHPMLLPHPTPRADSLHSHEDQMEFLSFSLAKPWLFAHHLGNELADEIYLSSFLLSSPSFPSPFPSLLSFSLSIILPFK